MIVVMKEKATAKEISKVAEAIKQSGLWAYILKGNERTIINITGDERRLEHSKVLTLDGVERVLTVSPPFRLASRNFKAQDTLIKLGKEKNKCVTIGGKDTFTVIAGPCAVESEEQIFETARKLKKIGVNILRGGAYKPRTSPYSFKGLGKKGLDLLTQVKKELDLYIATELLYLKELDYLLNVADIIQIGARNMQNYEVLEEVGKLDKPVLLKRGFSNTIEELLLSAEHILVKGNKNIILCERGIRTFEKYTRNTLDISAVPVIRHLSHLPIIIDPSHACGERDFVPSLCYAATASGANGIIVEVHPNPQAALCDGGQSLTIKNFSVMYHTIKNIAKVLNKTLN